MPPTPGISMIFRIFRDFGFLTHGMCRYDHFKISDFSSKNEFWKNPARLSLRRSFLGRTVYIFHWKVHIWVVRTYIFWSKVHIWVVRTLYFLKKSLNLGRKSSQFLKRPLIWVVSQANFWKGSLYLSRKSSQFLKRPLTWGRQSSHRWAWELIGTHWDHGHGGGGQGGGAKTHPITSKRILDTNMPTHAWWPLWGRRIYVGHLFTYIKPAQRR